MLLIRPCPFHSLHVVVRIQNIFLITFLPAKDTKFHHQTLTPLTSQFTKRYYVLASHSSNGSCHTQSQPAQPALGGRCVCREAGGVRNGGAWSSGMLGQALQAFDTAYWDHTRFLPCGIKQVLKLKPQCHLGLVPRQRQVSGIVIR